MAAHDRSGTSFASTGLGDSRLRPVRERGPGALPALFVLTLALSGIVALIGCLHPDGIRPAHVVIGLSGVALSFVLFLFGRSARS